MRFLKFKKMVRAGRNQNFLTSVFAFFTLLSSAFFVEAELATNLGIDIKASSLGHAVTADPPGIMALHFNPAGLAKLEGRRMDMQFLMVDLDATLKLSAPPGYEVFGFSDDPVVCADPATLSTSECASFVVAESEIAGISLYIPVLDDVIDVAGIIPTPPIPMPPAFSIKPPGSKFTFANAVYAPLIGGMFKEDDDPGRFLVKRIAIERVNYLAPSVGYEINDHWSVGANVQFAYGAMYLQTDVRAPNELLAFVRVINESICAPFTGSDNFVTSLLLFGICGSGVGIGPFRSLAEIALQVEDSLVPAYNLGVLWEPNDKFAWGAVWHSEAVAEFKGDIEVTYAPEVALTYNSVGSSTTGALALAVLGIPRRIPESEGALISMDLVFPAHFQTGIKWRFLPKWQINYDVNWTDYGKWDAFDIKFDRQLTAATLARIIAPGSSPNNLRIPLEWESNWNWGVGLEYQLNDRIALRLGYEPRGSVIPDGERAPIGPLADGIIFAVGMGYKWDHDTEIDLGLFKFVTIDDAPADTQCLANCTGIENLIYNPYAGLDIESSFAIYIAGLAFRTSF